ncbi:MAG TPA: hypothetical protein VFD70_11930 [Anaerolineae bacterium]|nr:hypothetical protein [Anaerolineae bacterium]
MDAIVDASSLIVLAKQNVLGLLGQIFQQVYITPQVHAETVIAGTARGYADAGKIEQAIQDGRLRLLKPRVVENRLAKSIEQRTPTLSYSDCLTLACAKLRGLTLVMEEQRGRREAVTLGITYMTLQVLPLHAYLIEKMSFAECDSLLTNIAHVMHTDQAVLTVLRTAAQEIERLRSGRGETRK